MLWLLSPCDIKVFTSNNKRKVFFRIILKGHNIPVTFPFSLSLLLWQRQCLLLWCLMKVDKNVEVYILMIFKNTNFLSFFFCNSKINLQMIFWNSSTNSNEAQVDLTYFLFYVHIIFKKYMILSEKFQ